MPMLLVLHPMVYIFLSLLLLLGHLVTLRKHAYSNILKILPSKNENFQIKNSDIFQDSAQNIDFEYSLDLCFEQK